ncbi:phosphotransferase enzyme family protein [Ceratobasidium sp. AG-Ba]|nr:phosphotransferase enzyme family protein [Ceratobasidium sp. AG-Ba]
MLVHRLPGQHLFSIWGQLDTGRSCDIAKQVAQLLAKSFELRFPPALAPYCVKLCIGRTPTTSPWPDVTEMTEQSNDTSAWAPTPTTFSEYVHTRLAEFRTNAARNVSGGRFKVELYEQLLDFSRDLSNTFALSGRVALFHRDFAPRKILADSIQESGTWAITGVLD